MVSKSALPDSFIAQWWIPQRLVMLFIIPASQVYVRTRPERQDLDRQDLQLPPGESHLASTGL